MRANTAKAEASRATPSRLLTARHRKGVFRKRVFLVNPPRVRIEITWTDQQQQRPGCCADLVQKGRNDGYRVT